MNAAIRRIQEVDIEGYRAALNSVASERDYLLMLEAPPLESVASFVRTNIERDYAQYVAVVESEIVGWADIIPDERETLKHIGGLGMGIRRDHRRKGIGQALLQNVVAHSFKMGLTRLELEVFANNAAAIALYEKHGFEREGTKRNARRIDGRYLDAHIMALCSE